MHVNERKPNTLQDKQVGATRNLRNPHKLYKAPKVYPYSSTRQNTRLARKLIRSLVLP